MAEVHVLHATRSLGERDSAAIQELSRKEADLLAHLQMLERDGGWSHPDGPNREALNTAQQRLKEAFMWARRAIERPNNE